MAHWLIAIVILTVQEVVSFNAFLLRAYNGQYPLAAVHAIFAVATIFDIWVGYAFGLYAKRKWSTGKIARFAHRISDRYIRTLGKRGRLAALLFLGTVSFPYVNAFVAAWLEIPLGEAWIPLFIGNLISYASYWALVLGAAALFPHSFMAFPLLISAIIVGIIFFKQFRS